MSTASYTPVTRKNLSETQLIIAAISCITVASFIFTIGGSFISTAVVISGVLGASLIGFIIQHKYTQRASMRVAFAGAILSIVIGGIIFTTGMFLLPAVFAGVFIIFAVLQLAIYF